MSDRFLLEMSAMKAVRIGGKLVTKLWSCVLRKQTRIRVL